MSSPDRVITLKINDIELPARDNQTILEVAKENNIFIPTLCHIPGLTNIGACRLCIIEIKGLNKLLPACVTRVAENMEVFTDTERLRKYRLTILQLLFSERNHVCSVCVSNGNCDLQRLAQDLGMLHVSTPYRYPKLDVDASHQRFVADHNRCVLCARCVRVCDEVEGAHTWDIKSRGHNSRVITDMNDKWGASETCTSCGKCVNVCPTGALTEKGKGAGEMKKKRQFLSHLAIMREEWK